MHRFVAIVIAAGLFALPAVADWNPGEPHKMHFPQLPDPHGWDVNATFPKVLADDWLCTGTGPVADFHIWGSWHHDIVGQITAIDLSIHANDPGPPGMPVNPALWWRRFYPGQWTERVYGQGEQGWYDPNTGYWNKPDHFLYYQYNFMDFPDPFIQEEGTIYWLNVSVHVADPETQWGWKTSRNRFRSAAVWGDYPDPQWRPLADPITGQPLDMAFVITPEPASALLLVCGAAALRRRR